jgi:hypothetical protein
MKNALANFQTLPLKDAARLFAALFLMPASPNGRVGDLLSIASCNTETADEAAAIGRTLRGLKLEGLPGVGG